MRVRPPSLGFVYLALAVAAFVWFFYYLSRPMWWELKDAREREVAEAAYLLRIASDGPEQRRASWLSAALRLAGQNQDWELGKRVVAQAQDHEVDLDGDVLIEIVPERCWAVGLQVDRWTRGAGAVALLLRNDGGQDATFRIVLNATAKCGGRVGLPGEAGQTFSIPAGEETTVEHVVPPRSTIWIEAAADVPAKWRNKKGFRIARVEVVS